VQQYSGKENALSVFIDFQQIKIESTMPMHLSYQFTISINSSGIMTAEWKMNDLP